MPRACSICNHPQREAIDTALVVNESYRNIAERFSVSLGALSRHRADHLPAHLVKAKEAKEAAHADDLLTQIHDLQQRTLAILERAEKTGRLPLALQAIREARGNLTLLAKLMGELQEQQTTVNVLVTSSEWLHVRTTLLEALGPFPEARQAVARALLEVDGAE